MTCQRDMWYWVSISIQHEIEISSACRAALLFCCSWFFYVCSFLVKVRVGLDGLPHFLSVAAAAAACTHAAAINFEHFSLIFFLFFFLFHFFRASSLVCVAPSFVLVLFEIVGGIDIIGNAALLLRALFWLAGCINVPSRFHEWG